MKTKIIIISMITSASMMSMAQKITYPCHKKGKTD